MIKKISKQTYKKNTFLFDKEIYKNLVIVPIKKTNNLLLDDYVYYFYFNYQYYKTNNKQEIFDFVGGAL